MNRRTFTITILLLLVAIVANAQIWLMPLDSHPVWDLEEGLLKGEKPALFKLSEYFDSKEKLVEYLGHHRMETTVGMVAKRMVIENALFLDGEFRLDYNSTGVAFREFLDANSERIQYSEIASSFLITPLEEREVEFRVRALSSWRKKELENREARLLQPKWVSRFEVEKLIEKKDPKALLVISSLLYRVRNRFNSYYSQKEEFTDLLQYLTNTEIGVLNNNGELVWKAEEDFNSMSQLNLLTFFAKHYQDYKWDHERLVFVNPNLVVEDIDQETKWFHQLIQKDDSLALDALIKLASADPEKFRPFAQELRNAYFDPPNHFGRSVFDLVEQLAELTGYCRKYQIDFEGTIAIREKIALLKEQIPFTTRRKLEDSLVQSLTLENITALEVWALIDHSNFQLQNSAGRILDIFYSKNWKNLVSNSRYLEIYLIKSYLFKKIGLSGSHRNYIRKFLYASEETKSSLLALQPKERIVSNEAQLALSYCKAPRPRSRRPNRFFLAIEDRKLRNLEHRLLEWMTNVTDSARVDDVLSTLLSRISYEQIKVAMDCIEDYPFKDTRLKYTFLERDFAFLFMGDFNRQQDRREFLDLYVRFSEYDLYAYLLDQAKIDYKEHDGSLDFDKIYQLLKFGVWDSFVGSHANEVEVYSLIKLLEINFHTTLGFSAKLCQSNNMYFCSSIDRAEAWMDFLVRRKLLKKADEEPISLRAG